MASDTRAVNRGRLTLIVIFAFFALPLGVAWLLNFGGEWVPGATVNHGTLVQPVRPVDTVDLVDAAGAALEPDLFRGEWTLVYRLAGECDAVCHQVLYVLRQVRLAQGKNIDRVRRLLLLDAVQTPPWVGEVQTHYPGLHIAHPNRAGGADRFPAPGRIYLVDPLGNLMMEYAPDAEPRGLIKDLERLLRISYVG
ncbi:MAG: SCO family protein [Gammaproteobacteria bacterium]